VHARYGSWQPGDGRDAGPHKTELAFTVSGLIPDGIARGPVVGIDVFRMVGDGFDPSAVMAGKPFGGSPLYALDITGADLLAAIETTLAAGVDDLSLQVSGMRYVFDSKRTAGARVVAAYIHGKPLDPARSYRATVNFGVLQGLPKLGVKVSNVQPIGGDEFDAVLDFTRRQHVLLYASQGRIVDVATPCR